jgi:NTE family protein
LFSLTKVEGQQNNLRPKIGLTLSGGGAKGLAHIGILKAIDSAGLKIDYITGTSMGAVIGSLYSIGYSANQIEEMTRKIDWDIY